MKKALVIERETLVRKGLVALLREVDGIECVAEAGSAEDALDLVRKREFDLVLIEWRLPGLGGLEAIERMKRIRSNLTIVVVTGCVDDPFPARLIQAGADALVSKTATLEDLLKAVRSALNGGRYVSPDVAQRMVCSQHDDAARSPFEELSNRELQVMLMFLDGQRVQDISNKLCLSPKTVSTYRYRMFEKLGVRGEAELTRLAYRYGIFEGGSAIAALTAQRETHH